jgi:hypothetical protein
MYRCLKPFQLSGAKYKIKYEIDRQFAYELAVFKMPIHQRYMQITLVSTIKLTHVLHDLQ